MVAGAAERAKQMARKQKVAEIRNLKSEATRRLVVTGNTPTGRGLLARLGSQKGSISLSARRKVSEVDLNWCALSSESTERILFPVTKQGKDRIQ